ncbi:Ubiquitin thioesterase otubain-like [Hondaea fermentalgiana]|uniref:ubiquitinyl hydrolase 1 n=1 Tax=Hondaea fermentalgiana TaxID=2315210 RepID=A0A2R5G5Z3_9STRA|nr:Ubiquitin thioesterase otubain-like [Hondaea fermentalgiana]|eukprot:GBG26467.1 Ubiquitin thioesterase otubain-like [Hondaea fermentalgiana]
MDADDELRAQAAAQEAEIEGIVKSRPLIGPKARDFVSDSEMRQILHRKTQESGFESLREELEGTEAFVRKIPSLESKYTGIRHVRGDGNCFYRSFVFRMFEVARTDNALRTRLLDVAREALPYLTDVGYEEVSIETFTDFCVETLESLDKLSQEDLEVLFGEDGESDYLVWFGRLACAGFLKHQPDRFLPFIPESFCDMNSFCSREVEPMGKEADQPQVIALAEYWQLRVCVEYIDSSDESTTSTHVFGPGDDDAPGDICLLYRPGHYEIIYA